MTATGEQAEVLRRPVTPDDYQADTYQRVKTAPQQIAAAIRGGVLEGSLLPGALLPSEEELAERFGVSRPTVREAIRLLREGQVLSTERGRRGGHRVQAIIRHTGTFDDSVALAMAPGELSYEQLVEVRHHFETLSAELAAEHRDADDITRLEELAELVPVADGPLTARLALQYDLLFHRRLADCTHNPLITGLSRATLVAFRKWPDRRVLTAAPEDLLAHLDEVLAAVRVGDRVGAREAMSKHLEFPRWLVAQGALPPNT